MALIVLKIAPIAVVVLQAGLSIICTALTQARYCKLLNYFVMTHKQAYIYTFLVFALICLFSYMAAAQPHKLSLQEALSLTLTNNRDIKVISPAVDRSQQAFSNF
jgi:hypothetical protein